jgi:hypothetical protein
MNVAPEHCATPVGWPCVWCEEQIGVADDGIIDASGNVFHRECFMRPIIGSVAHLLRRCCCFVPNSTEDDPKGYSKREAAKLALDLWEEQTEI